MWPPSFKLAYQIPWQVAKKNAEILRGNTNTAANRLNESPGSGSSAFHDGRYFWSRRTRWVGKLSASTAAPRARALGPTWYGRVVRKGSWAARHGEAKARCSSPS